MWESLNGGEDPTEDAGEGGTCHNGADGPQEAVAEATQVGGPAERPVRGPRTAARDRLRRAGRGRHVNVRPMHS